MSNIFLTGEHRAARLVTELCRRLQLHCIELLSDDWKGARKRFANGICRAGNGCMLNVVPNTAELL